VTTYPVGAGNDPQRLLADSRRLARQVRTAQRATWFPLVVLAAVTFAALPVYGFGGYARSCRAQPGGGRICTVYSTAALAYWPIALVLAYEAIAGFYVRRARSRGVGTRVFPYVAVGIAVAVLTGGAAAWRATHPPVGEYDILGLHLVPGQGEWLFQVLTPASAIGLGLLVLAAVERSRAVFLLAVGYVAFAFVPLYDLGWVISRPSPWAPLPRLVLGGGALLLAGLLFAVRQRSRPGGWPVVRPTGSTTASISASGWGS
jgi:hypothetical protein